MWLVIGLGCMGYLVGFLCGMTVSPIVQPLVALLFAFVGGSVFVLLSKLTSEDRSLAGRMISALSFCCVLGVASGFFTSRHQLLSPNRVVDVCLSKDPPPFCYLRSGTVSQANIIDEKKRAKVISTDEAYDELYKLIENQSKAGDQ
ncbi:MAG TPA: hypothetical protein VK578_05010 [Edaphobacter sp.]|nr:hypothetical protein [Edaphobacter sp.]